MIKYIHICDQCKKEEITTKNCPPETWVRLGICVDGNFSYEYPSERYGRNMTICEECATRVGLQKDSTPKTQEEVKTIESKLYDIFCEIIENTMEERR